MVRRRQLDALRATLAIVLLTYVWRVQDLAPGIGALKIPTIVTGAAVVLLMLDGKAQRQLAAAARHRTGRLIIWFIIVAGISVVTSLEVGWSLDYFSRTVFPALALAIVIPAGVFIARDASMFAALQVTGASIYCIAILVRFHVGADGRLGSLVYYDGNDIGMLLVCTLPLCAYFARHAAHGFSRLLAVGAAVLFVATIAETGSRGAFLGLLAVGAYIALRFKTVKKSTRFAIVAFAGVLLFAGATTKYWSEMDTILHPTTDYNWVGNAEGGRMSIWARGIGYAADRPLTGVGVGAFNIAEGTISSLARQQEYGRGLKWSSPHNSFVQELAEVGFPGLILFTAILWSAYRSATRTARIGIRRGGSAARIGELAQAHAAALAGYVVSGFFLTQGYAPYLYFVIGMVIGLDLTARAAWRADDDAMDEAAAIDGEPEPGDTELGTLVWASER
jgi:O-antigen ligase